MAEEELSTVNYNQICLNIMIIYIKFILILNSGQGGQDGATDPDGVLPFGRSDDLDLDGGGSKGGDLLLHAVSNTRVHGGATSHDGVGIQVLPDVHIALHD